MEVVQLLPCLLEGSLCGGVIPLDGRELGLDLTTELCPQLLELTVVAEPLGPQGGLVGCVRHYGAQEEGEETLGPLPHGSNQRKYTHAV